MDDSIQLYEKVKIGRLCVLPNKHSSITPIIEIDTIAAWVLEYGSASSSY